MSGAWNYVPTDAHLHPTTFMQATDFLRQNIDAAHVRTPSRYYDDLLKLQQVVVDKSGIDPSQIKYYFYTSQKPLIGIIAASASLYDQDPHPAPYGRLDCVVNDAGGITAMGVIQWVSTSFYKGSQREQLYPGTGFPN